MELKAKIKEIKATGEVVFLASTTQLDSHRDVITKMVMKKISKKFAAGADEADRIKLLYNHNQTEQIGVPLSMKVTNEGLEVTGKLNLETEIGLKAYNEIKFNLENKKPAEWSIGYITNDAEFEDGIRFLTDITVKEISFIPFLASNAGAKTLEIKNKEDLNEKDKEKVVLEEKNNHIKAQEEKAAATKRLLILNLMNK